MSDKSSKKSNKGDNKVTKSRKIEKIGKHQDEKTQRAAASAFSLLVADGKAVDPSLSSLFAVKQPAIKAKPVSTPLPRKVDADSSQDDDNDAELSELDEEIDEDDDALEEVASGDNEANEPLLQQPRKVEQVATLDGEYDLQPKRKRKKKNAEAEVEDAYMSRLAREEERDAERMAAERAAKRQKALDETEDAEQDDDDAADDKMDVDQDKSDDDDAMSPPPQHETQQQADDDLAKANRTVFLGNVSTAAITSKSSRKVFEIHLKSFFNELPTPKDGAKHKLESIRFRSTPYASAIPKKASYAKKEIMDATTKSSNAYAVYSSPILAREAAKRLNGTIVLQRHLRVDEVAHPSKIDHHRCIFVGNLGFVDDESNILEANAEDGREVRKRGKEPADIEEGLWRTFGRCGTVESVRVIRDSTTRVGKGIAYVQFEDENAVEAALQYNDKKFPPMLPRKLRVSRAKAPKRNAKPGSDHPKASALNKTNGSGYQRKLTGHEASQLGRASKLLGRAAAAKARRPGPGSGSEKSHQQRPTATKDRQQQGGAMLSAGIKKPEAFIFEGHRATEKQGKSGLKLGGKHSNSKSGGSKSKVTKRSATFKKSQKSGGAK